MMISLHSLNPLLPNSTILTQDLQAYATDQSGEVGVPPRAVIIPRTEDDICTLMAWATQHHIPVVPRAGATGKSGGCNSTSDAIVLSLSHFNQVLEKDAANRVLVVQSCVTTQQVKDAAYDMGLYYPPDPGSLETCTIGGNVACNAGGPRALKYGVTGHYVLGVEGILPTGKRFKFGGKNHKDVAGYDFKSLMVGSEGTLGIITKVYLRLIQPPKVVRTVWLGFSSFRDAGQTLLSAFQHHIDLAAAEFFDDTCYKALRAYVGPSLPFRDAKAHIVMECHGYSEDTVASQIQTLVTLAKEHGLQDHFMGEDLWTYRYKISPSLTHYSTYKRSQDISVPPGEILSMLTYLDTLNAQTPLTVLGFGHLGDGNIHVNILGFPDHAAIWETEYRRLEEAALVHSLTLGGTLTGEHGVGLAKLPYLTTQVGTQTRALYQAVKQAFDPAGILNPGKAI